MGLDEFNMNGFDSDEARYQRDNRNNPSEFAPGQGSMDDIFSSSPTQSVADSGQMGDIFSSGGSFGGNSFGGGFGNDFGGLGQQMGQPIQQQKSTEEELFDAGVKAVKGTYKGVTSFAKSFGEGISKATPLYAQTFGKNTLIVSIIAFVFFVICGIFGLSFGLKCASGCCLSAGVGIGVLLFSTKAARGCNSLYKDGDGESAEVSPDAGTNMGGFESLDTSGFQSSNDDWGSGSGDDWDSNSDDDWGSSSDDDWGDEEDDYDDYEDDDYDFSGVDGGEPEEGMSSEEALATAQKFEKGMYARQYFYDMFTKTLPKLTPDFNKMCEYDEDDDVFLFWEEQLRDAASVTGCKETDECILELLELRENLFTIELVSTRPTGFKPDQVANELANIYGHSEGRTNVSAKAKPVGSKCYITVFTGKTAMISLRDMYTYVEDFMLDRNNYMPVVLGVGTDGNVIKFDFKKLESIIITGMPRSGKSWFCQCILYQMCAFVPPTELNLYICDPKDGVSDYKSFVLPHVKKFVSGDDNIVNALRKVIKVEGPRRKKIIGDAGFVNIWDYKEANPEVKLPIIYVIIDEAVTLAERMEKETKKEFQGLLVELISQLPALGIRAFLIPHVIKNDVIAKTATDLVPCKLSVCGDAEHIEKATGSKPKDFPHKLTNKGDMAVKMPAISPDTMFVHGPALTDSNPKNNQLFDYARKVWSMLEPEECETSVVAKEAEISSENKEILDKLENNAFEDDAFFS